MPTRVDSDEKPMAVLRGIDEGGAAALYDVTDAQLAR
ncbi:hypothetical protein FIV07_10090 [Mycobacterium sp. THAF192]|nr:hypothetical protein FIV07_10090 [Mycobacterium sp. THAF192]